MFGKDKYRITYDLMFSKTHFITLFILLVLTFIIVYFARRIKTDSKLDKFLRIFVASTLLITEIGYIIWKWTTHGFEIDLIPLTGFCAMANALTIYYLFTDNRKLAEITFYYAITGSFFSLVFPTSKYTFPHFRFIHFFYNHYMFLMAAIYYLITKKITINRKSFYKSSLYLLIYSIFVLIMASIYVGVTNRANDWFYLLESPFKEISDALSNTFLGIYLYSVLLMGVIYIIMNIWYYIFYYVTNKKLK